MSSRSSFFTPKKSTVALSPSMARTFPGTPRHMGFDPPSRRRRVGDDGLAERDPAVAGGDVAMSVYREGTRKLAEDALGEPRVLEAPARQDDGQGTGPARGAPHELGARRRERGVEAGGHGRG